MPFWNIVTESCFFNSVFVNNMPVSFGDQKIFNLPEQLLPLIKIKTTREEVIYVIRLFELSKFYR